MGLAWSSLNKVRGLCLLPHPSPGPALPSFPALVPSRSLNPRGVGPWGEGQPLCCQGAGKVLGP